MCERKDGENKMKKKKIDRVINKINRGKESNKDEMKKKLGVLIITYILSKFT